LRGAVLTGVAAGLAACALFTDVDGFSNGPEGSGDAATSDAPIVVTSADASEEDTGVTLDVDASFDAPPDAPTFRDEFTRSDNADVGNGWVEKSPDVYAIAGGAAVKAPSGTNYQNNLVTRPAPEDRADVEVSATFTLAATFGFPQVFARAQRSTVATAGAYDAYIFFLAEPGVAMLARQRGMASEVQLAKIDLPSQLAGGSRLRLTLRVYGQAPAILEASIDRIEGSGTTRLGEVKLSDGSVDRIDAAGTMGFTGGIEAIAAIDDFEWRALGTQ